jgi:hypothetical protein
MEPRTATWAAMDMGQGRVGAGFTGGREEVQGENFSTFAASDSVLASAPANGQRLIAIRFKHVDRSDSHAND